jgi:hypothetical protein
VIPAGGGDVPRVRRGVARPMVVVVAAVDDERRRNEAAKLGAPGAPAKTTTLVRSL